MAPVLQTPLQSLEIPITSRVGLEKLQFGDDSHEISNLGRNIQIVQTQTRPYVFVEIGEILYLEITFSEACRCEISTNWNTHVTKKKFTLLG